MTQSENAVGFSGLVDLAARSLGGRAIACSDDFFAGMDHLVAPGRGVFLPGEYTDRGKLMDGWESRRRRGGPDHDFCVLSLGAPGKIRALDIDTNHFLGNHPPYAAVDALQAKNDDDALASTDWQEILPQAPLKPGAQNLFVVAGAVEATHVRLRIFPDGGVARLRIWGDVTTRWALREDDRNTQELLRAGEVDLVSLANGGMALACSDMFFSPMQNLILPSPATDMGGGWETRRKRGPGHDWIVLRLGARGTPSMAIFDTAFFNGNYPERAWVEGIDASGVRITDLLHRDAKWRRLSDDITLAADERQRVPNLFDLGAVSHVRVNIAPDGGLSRFRLYGALEAPGLLPHG